MGVWARNSKFSGFHCRVSEKKNWGNKPVPFGEYIPLRLCTTWVVLRPFVKQVRVVNSWGLKWSVFIVQKLALHKNRVEFRQQSNGAISTSLATPHDVARCRQKTERH